MSSMSVKATTKVWADKPEAAVDASGAAGTLTAEDKAKIGAEDLTAVLNKAANKDWVDDRKRVTGHGNANMDKDAFFKLMLAQLKNQDPMNPLKNHEMAAQLAQFSTLEQMTNMNSTLGKIEGKSAQPENFQALNLIGKTVAGDASKVTRTQFDDSHDFNFTLPQDASEVKVRLMNAKGDIIRNYQLSDAKMGVNKITWNGNNEAGIKQLPGEYIFSVEAKNNVGMKIPVSTEFKGEITGMSFSAEGPVLQIGKQTLKMRDIRQITDSSAKPVDQNLTNRTGLDLKNTVEATQNNIKKEAETSSNAMPAGVSGGNVMTDVAMSRELHDKLQKEMK